MTRYQRDEFFGEAALWFQWAADACRERDRVEARKCAITGLRVVWRLFHRDGRFEAQRQPRHPADEIQPTVRTTEPFDRVLSGGGW